MVLLSSSPTKASSISQFLHQHAQHPSSSSSSSLSGKWARFRPNSLRFCAWELTHSRSSQGVAVADLEILICNPATHEVGLLPKCSPSEEDLGIGVAFGPEIKENYDIPGSILSVDMEEHFEVVGLPDTLTELSFLIDFEGCLSVVAVFDKDEPVVIWILKNENEYVWEKKCSADTDDSSWELVEFEEFEPNAHAVFPYTESLLPCKLPDGSPTSFSSFLLSSLDERDPRTASLLLSANSSSLIFSWLTLGWLLITAISGSIGDGLQNPLMMFILSEVINSYGSSSGALTNADVDKFALRLFYVAIGVGLAAFCWVMLDKDRGEADFENENEVS
ncbi:hypothetical protein J5N97_000440 [Dioscorea zingiberensis]|uniref:Uncharacterized protein n=1 Tax=Dioscorea zingiberensis TaxID=325984 RepID=A0A9D5H1N5_9LILI|nr:hypothetical protein J5N97_000440 [Dioscorea zingiberensis]